MEKLLLCANSKDEFVKVLGLEVANVRMGKLHIKINGVDLMQDVVLDDLQITADIDPVTPEEKR